METAAAAARASSLSAGLASRSLDPATQPPGVRFVVAKHGLAAALRGTVRSVHRGEEESRGGGGSAQGMDGRWSAMCATLRGTVKDTAVASPGAKWR